MAGQRRNPVSGTTSAPNIFVGRERELDAITGEFRAASLGSLRVVLVLGDPGIGKTRLVREASALCQAAGATVLWGRCHEEPGTPPYWPWTQIIRTYASNADDAELRSDLGQSRIAKP